MELPAKVLIHNETLAVKGAEGVLVTINPAGYYEINLYFGERAHRTFFPIQQTVVIAQEPEEEVVGSTEIER
jgi:hypothetical protein